MSSTTTDPTYGYDLETLLTVGAPEPPDDFDEFWTALYGRAREVDVRARMISESADLVGEGRVGYDVEFGSLGGIRLGGWLSLPTDAAPERGLVVGHGYGGREAPDPDPLLAEAAILFFCTRGLPSRGRQPGIPDTGAFHVLHGIASRETYVHGGSAADLWCAVSALTELVPSAAPRIDYVGGSFGGGIGALALPWESRLGAACLEVPSFGNHPLRLTMPCTGSGEAVRTYAARRPEVVDVLRYFDAASAATFLRTPTHVAAALADPAVPPPGQFAVHNALAGPKELFVLTGGHMEYPGAEEEHRSLRTTQRRFLRAH
ncbi:MAG TPA: acetylxylan esterase [Actinopolymorphaceae bacterium]